MDVKYGGRQQGKSFTFAQLLAMDAMRREQERIAKAQRDTVWIDEATEISKEVFQNLKPTVTGIDLASGESWGESWNVYFWGSDGKIYVFEEGRRDVKPPPKKRAKPVDFFPNKIERIAKMPRYPGVWG